MKDSATRIETVCAYDYAGRVGVYLEADPNNNTYREIVYSYDENGNVTKVDETVSEYRWSNGDPVSDRSIYGYEYFYDYKNRLEFVKTNDAQKQYQYDDWDRLTNEVVSKVETEGTGDNAHEIITNIYTSTYGYHNATVGGTSVTTNQVDSKVTTSASSQYQSTLTYEYDDNGNITAIRDGTGANAKEITYEYDSANQLIRENNPYEDRTWVWTYDAAGNILSKKEYAYTLVETDELGNAPKTYAYGYGNSDWGDLLTSYDGRTFFYDDCTDLYDFKCGNLTDDGIWTYTWKQGRQLASMSRKDNTEDWSFEYDANGMRLKRTTGPEADDVTYTYVYTDGLLTRMTKGDIMLYFTYDAAGMPLTVSLHKGTNCKVKKGEACGTDCKTYYYVTNLQGDVIAILDETGIEVAEYSYDAWGRLLCDLDEEAETIYSLNPLFYRGYVYDRETGLYYLQSRYYNPEIGRFINADDIEYLGADGTLQSYNLFAYCSNNPVNFIDPSGHSILAITLSVLAVAGLITTGIGVATDNNTLTAIGLTAVAIPAMVSGGMALALATPAGIAVGSTTLLAGAGTAAFATAEYQEAFTGNNWMLDSGMSEEWYNGLMLTTATIATLGTMASGVTSSLRISRITEFGKLKGSNYKGIKFIQKHNGGTRYMSLEFHSGHVHKGYKLHWQLNKWSRAGEVFQKGVAWWTLWLKPIY